MPLKNIYIKGVGCISPQFTFNNENFLEEITQYNGNYLTAKEPEYKEFISPVRLRRMARIVKMGVTAAFISLKDAGVGMPNAIIAGTGLGCLEDTEKFLTAMIVNKEQMLTPTAFIQSTHNTVAAQIALILGCNNYNFTYTHRGFSFESALLDGMMQLTDGEANNVLVGGVEEMTPNYYIVSKRIGLWKKENVSNLDLLKSQTEGSLGGEGTAFFTLTSEETSKNYAQIRNITTIYKPQSYEAIEAKILKALEDSGLVAEEIDLVVLGAGGNPRQDEVYYSVAEKLFAGKPTAWFKHLSGEHYVAGSFGLWLACKILKTQSVPDIVKLNPQPVTMPIRNILLYNHFDLSNQSVFILSQC